MYVRKINDLQFYGLNNFTMYRYYGNRQSLAARKRERLAMCFESCEEAKRRNEQQAVKFTGVRKSPVGNVENMAWDKQALLEEVNGYSSDHVVNWSELARRYEVKNKNGEFAKNGGQIVQEYLKSQGVDVSRLKKRGADSDGQRIRKRMKRSAGGEITVPCPVPNEQLKTKLNDKILSGEYNVGELIVPRKVC